MTSRTRHMMIMAAMLFIGLPLATMEQRPWQIAVTAALVGMVLGEQGAAMAREERERRRQAGVYQPPKHAKTAVMLSSLGFAVLSAAVFFVMWDKGMIFPGTAPNVAGAVALVIGCAIGGVIWHWWMGGWYRDYFELDSDYRPRT
jgi:hypothetical protein